MNLAGWYVAGVGLTLGALMTLAMLAGLVGLVFLVLRRWARSTSDVSEERQMLNAVHEAGHAVVQALMFGPDSIVELAVRTEVSDETSQYGYMAGRPTVQGAELLWTMGNVRKQCTMICGGRAADEAVTGIIHAGASTDLENATDLLSTALSQWGLGNRLTVYDNELLGKPADLAEEVERELKGCYTRAKRIIGANREVVEGMAGLLMQIPPRRGARTLDQATIMSFLEANPPTDPGEL